MCTGIPIWPPCDFQRPQALGVWHGHCPKGDRHCIHNISLGSGGGFLLPFCNWKLVKLEVSCAVGRACCGWSDAICHVPEGRRSPYWVCPCPQASSAQVTVTIGKVSYLPSLGALFSPVSLHSLPSCDLFLVVSSHCQAPCTALGVPVAGGP